MNTFLGKSTVPRVAGFMGGGMANNYDKNREFNIFAQVRLGLYFSDKLSLYTAFAVQDSQQGHWGRTFRGMNGFNDQSVVLFESEYVDAKVGRDYLQQGPGRWGQLLFSDNAPAFDQYHVKLKKNKMHFSFWGMELSEREGMKRYINGHRLSLLLLKRIELGFNEAVIYGGSKEYWKLGLMNPLTFYHGYTLNQKTDNTNSFLSVDMDWFPFDRWHIWGELLIDDYQIDRKETTDLEPNEIGFTVGTNWADPMAMGGVDLRFEFTQVRNRTYNAPNNDWEKFLHRKEHIGYYLGNDLQVLNLMVSKWWLPQIKTTMTYNLTRKGEGTVKDEFNKDFLINSTVEKGYNEK